MNCPETATATALVIDRLSKRYGDSIAVDNVSLTLDSGESLAVIGHNGAGKTTLMKLVLGLTRPSSGCVTRGAYLGDTNAAPGQAVGFLPESVAFPGALRGSQVLAFYARLKRADRQQCDELLDLVGLAGAAEQRVDTYSKGMRQRLGLAQALLGSPRLLLLDEPTSGLDPFLRRHFYDIVGTRQKAGTAVIVSSHALTEIEARTDRIAIMGNGRLLELGSLEQLRHKAGLPVQLRVIHRPGAHDAILSRTSTAITSVRISDNQFTIACGEDEKLGLLHELTAQQDKVLDITVASPRLDDLYAHFVNGSDV